MCGCVDEWGTASQLTLDHIQPRSRGGVSLMSNATILCADCNGRKADGEATYCISLEAEERAARPRYRWSRQPVPRVPHGPWDETPQHQPVRTKRGVARVLRRSLPEWALPYYEVEYLPGEVPDAVRALVLSQYADPSHVPHEVRAVLG
jgi:hypothetical protein